MTRHKIQKPKRLDIQGGANRTLVIKLMAAATSYGFSILAARLMGADGFGQVAVFLSTAFILSILGARGQQVATLRFLPPLVADNRFDTAQSLVSWGFRRMMGTTALVFAVALIGSLIAHETGRLVGFSPATLTLGLLLIPLVGWVDYQSHVARGFQALTLSLVPKEILWRAVAGVILLGVWSLSGQGDLSPVFVLAILGGCLGLFILGQQIILHRHFGVRLISASGQGQADWAAASGPFWVSSVSNIFLAHADVLAVGILLGPQAAGYYFAANRLAMLLAFLQTSHNIVLGPALAQIWPSEGAGATAAAIRQATLAMTLPTVLVGAVLAFFAPQALLLFGPEFAQAAGPLRLLILAGVLNAALGPGDIALNMCGFHRVAMVASAAVLGASAILLVVGASLGGALGAAAGVALATGLRKLIFWGLAWQRLGIRTDVFALPQRLPPLKRALRQ